MPSIWDMERQLLDKCRDDMCAALHDPNEVPKKPTDARVSPVSDERGELVDIMRDTPPADVTGIDPAASGDQFPDI